MFLCGSDEATFAELNPWAETVREFPGCEGVEVASGRLARTPEFRSALIGSIFFSFDQYMFDR